jgi:hypothetical protein
MGTDGISEMEIFGSILAQLIARENIRKFTRRTVFTTKIIFRLGHWMEFITEGLTTKFDSVARGTLLG